MKMKDTEQYHFDTLAQASDFVFSNSKDITEDYQEFPEITIKNVIIDRKTKQVRKWRVSIRGNKKVKQ